jgi:hypothetical protein
VAVAAAATRAAPLLLALLLLCCARSQLLHLCLLLSGLARRLHLWSNGGAGRGAAATVKQECKEQTVQQHTC